MRVDFAKESRQHECLAPSRPASLRRPQQEPRERSMLKSLWQRLRSWASRGSKSRHISGMLLPQVIDKSWSAGIEKSNPPLLVIHPQRHKSLQRPAISRLSRGRTSSL